MTQPKPLDLTNHMKMILGEMQYQNILLKAENTELKKALAELNNQNEKSAEQEG